jgi:hypothetical protein
MKIPNANIRPLISTQTPPVTAGFQLWLKTDAGITANGNAQVTTWADPSGQGS